MSAAHAYQNDKAEEYARWRRRDHANIEAMQNLVIARIAEESGVEMPPNVRALISALQGAHGGGSVAYEPFSRDYLTIGAQLQFTGTSEAVRQRVRRWVDDLLRWQRDAGRELFKGEVSGRSELYSSLCDVTLSALPCWRCARPRNATDDHDKLRLIDSQLRRLLAEVRDQMRGRRSR